MWQSDWPTPTASSCLISKYDYSGDAYRRIAHSASAATQTISSNGDLAYLSLRLTFGGSPNPPTWCMFSELVTDLANEIGQCVDWDPERLCSPAQPVAPPPRRQGGSVPIRAGRPMSVVIPTPSGRVSRVDGFIDDLINVFLDTPENCRRQPHPVPLAMHVTSRPHAGDEVEPVPRRPLMILGRWSSDAFLVYIRPQVLEWTDNMSRDMIHHDSFLDATDNRRTPPTDPCIRSHQFNAVRSTHPVTIQRMHLHH